MASLRERYMSYFAHRGFAEIKSKSTKFRVLKGVNNQGSDMYIYLGKSGSVRVNSRDRLTDSVSITDIAKTALVKWERQHVEQ